MRRAPILLLSLLLPIAGCAADEGGTSAESTRGPNATNQAPTPNNNTNVNLGGAQDFGYFRRLVQDGIVPGPTDFDAAGFFAEHHTPLPEPDCGNRVCVQAMLGVMGNLLTGANCTMLQVGLNSPLGIDPENRPPLQLSVVVDVSGSMLANGKLDFVKSGLHQMAAELDDDDEIAIVAYASSSDLVLPLTRVGDIRSSLGSVIDSLQANGSTNLYDGLEEGYQALLDHYDSAAQNRLILLSDGVPTAGTTAAASIVEMSAAYNSDGIGLTTIGLGTDFNYSLMSSLAEQSDGNFYFVEDSSAVDEVFTQELAYFTVPVAFDVSIEVIAGEHYTFGEAYGSKLWVDNADGGSLEVPSVFLAHRASSEDVAPGDERRGGGSALLLELMPRDDLDSSVASGHVATVIFNYREPGTNEVITDVVDLAYPHHPAELLNVGHFDNEIVTKSFVVMNIFVALEQATLLFHGGATEDAIALLRRVIAGARDYEDSANDGMGDTDIRLDVELMELLIDTMLINGAPEPEFVDIPQDPWPRD